MHDFVRIGLTLEQVDALDNPRLRQGIEVKGPDPVTGRGGDSRAKKYIEQYGDRCWETDILPATVIRQALDDHVWSWLDERLWRQREREIEQARKLL